MAPRDLLPTYADVEAAAARLDGPAHHTPVLASRRLDEQVGAEVFLKCENFQRTGAFKFRGAYNALSRFSPEQVKAGVVAYSSGNHAQAIALAARLLGLPATIVMPTDAPAGKLAATRAYGGEVIQYDRHTDDREAIGRALATERGLTLVPPYDHPDIIAGQGTAARELLLEVPDLDTLFVPLGGGGLLSGTALAVQALAPDAELFGVEPEAGDDGRRSMAQGSIVHIETPTTIADGAQTQHLGALTFAIIRQMVAGVRTVSDADLISTMRLAAGTLKIVVEPTGCLGLAAGLAAGRAGAGDPGQELSGRRIGVILSGGNVDPDRFARWLGSSRPEPM